VSLERDDLVAYVLGALEEREAERMRAALAADAEGAAELDEIERHLALHAQAPAIEPAPNTWDRIRESIETEPVPTPFLRRFWMPAAAAALVAAAFLWPRDRAPRKPTVVHGVVAQAPDGAFTSRGVARISIGNDVTVTMDAGTTLADLGPERLALRAGRVFLNVRRRGYVVETPRVRIRTLGTAFEVALDGEKTRVAVERGRVRCTDADLGAVDVAAGGVAAFSDRIARAEAGKIGLWFRTPSLEANLLSDDAIRVVLGNDMPDPIQLAPPVGGEPLFYATFAGHTYPLTPSDPSPLRSGTVTLAPNGRLRFDLRLPRPLEEREALSIAHPASGARAEVKR